MSCNNAGNKSTTSGEDKADVKETACMERILKKDSILGNIRNHASEKLSLSETIDNYTNSLKSLDYTNCPDSFTTALHQHMAAWLEVKKVSDRYPELRGELHVIFDELEKKGDSLEFKSYKEEIFTTWNIVEKISTE